MVALLTSVRNSPCFGGLGRTKTCHWQLFVRPSTCFLCYFLHNAKSNIPSPCAGSFEVLQTSIQRTQVAVSHKLIKSLPLRGISSGRRGAAPYLYTQSVCAACFASILRRQSRSMAFPDGNISLLLKKQDKNTGCRPLPVHANRVQICHASQALSGG